MYTLCCSRKLYKSLIKIGRWKQYKLCQGKATKYFKKKSKVQYHYLCLTVWPILLIINFANSSSQMRFCQFCDFTQCSLKEHLGLNVNISWQGIPGTSLNIRYTNIQIQLEKLEVLQVWLWLKYFFILLKRKKFPLAPTTATTLLNSAYIQL